MSASIEERNIVRSLFATLSGQAGAVDVRQEIARDLNWLLNTRRGTCVQNREYGIPHLTELGSLPDAESQLLVEIEQSVRTFEPRMKRVQVDAIPAEEQQAGAAVPMCFVLMGEVNGEGLRGTYRARLRINYDSKVVVSQSG